MCGSAPALSLARPMRSVSRLEARTNGVRPGAWRLGPSLCSLHSSWRRVRWALARQAGSLMSRLQGKEDGLLLRRGCPAWWCEAWHWAELGSGALSPPEEYRWRSYSWKHDIGTCC
jgi:hypothetical protein